MTNYRWVICAMLFMATTINYMDRQVLSLTWKDFIAPEFHWTDSTYGNVAAIFSLVYAVANLLSGLAHAGVTCGPSVYGRWVPACMPFADWPLSVGSTWADVKTSSMQQVRWP